MEDLHVSLEAMGSAASTYDSVASLLGKVKAAPSAGPDDVGHIGLQQWLSELFADLTKQREEMQKGIRKLSQGLRDTERHIREADEKAAEEARKLEKLFSGQLPAHVIDPGFSHAAPGVGAIDPGFSRTVDGADPDPGMSRVPAASVGHGDQGWDDRLASRLGGAVDPGFSHTVHGPDIDPGMSRIVEGPDVDPGMSGPVPAPSAGGGDD